MTARPLQAGAAMTNVGPMDDHIIIERVAQPYAGITSFVVVGSLGTAADRIPEVFAWLGVRGVAPVGTPFFRYDVIDMERGFTVTVGVPVAAIGAEEPGEVAYGVLPAGALSQRSDRGTGRERMADRTRLPARRLNGAAAWPGGSYQSQAGARTRMPAEAAARASSPS